MWHIGFGMWWLWIVIAIVIFFLLKFLKESGSHSSKKPKSALEILEERYAKGEIDKEEFEQKRKDIKER